MSSLLNQIQDAAVDAKEPIANVLRKLAVLASRLNNDELGAWAFRELNGYGTDDELPEYRVVPAHASANLAGSFGSGYNNVTIPAALLPEKLRNFAERVYLRHPIASLEELATKDSKGSGELTFPWPGNLTALMQDKFNGMVLVGAWQSTSAASPRARGWPIAKASAPSTMHRRHGSRRLSLAASCSGSEAPPGGCGRVAGGAELDSCDKLVSGCVAEGVDPMKHREPVIHSDPEIMGGTPVFVGTRVPLETLLDYLEAGQPLSEFLEDFPTVTREQAVAALEQAKEALLARARPA
jgi:uncharacterized protein (DUF433 family)